MHKAHSLVVFMEFIVKGASSHKSSIKTSRYTNFNFYAFSRWLHAVT